MSDVVTFANNVNLLPVRTGNVYYAAYVYQM